MASATVVQVLEIVSPESDTDKRIAALEGLLQEIGDESQRDRMGEILQAVKESPRRGRRNGS
jgi:hypothetical protein